MTVRALPSLAMVALASASCARPGPPPLVINESASMPRGVYRLAAGPVMPGSIVVVRPPAAARAYVAKLGADPDARLLKHVAALRGDRVCSDGSTLRWSRGAAIILSEDRQGRPLPAWRACRQLGPSEVLVIGDSAISFDSRYFGPVRTSATEGPYRMLWRW